MHFLTTLGLVVQLGFTGMLFAQASEVVHYFSVPPEGHAIEHYFVDVDEYINSQYAEYDPGGYWLLVTASDSFLVYVNSIDIPGPSETYGGTDIWMGIKQVSSSGQRTWLLTPDELGNLGYIQRYSLEESGIFFVDEAPYLWMRLRSQSHCCTGYSDSIYRLSDEGAVFHGYIPGYYDEDGAGPEDVKWTIRQYASVGVIKKHDRGIEVERIVSLMTIHRDFKYTEHYLVSPDSVMLHGTTQPTHFISYIEADSILQQSLDLYYSDAWEERAKKENGRVERANLFSHHFGDLTLMRRDYAPAHYNLACMEAQLGYAKDALETLRTALALDANYLKKALRDPDLESVRTLPEFNALMSKMQ